ncbi:MAG: exonuclease SbcCD subunit D C-terminal domain-containing protein [Candidatus Riflebacteria bacterium]|nr:exonuclease SbcCD subunit D C-terminal domain-containing protein [Candidatus Riflebacteria bacterium]
MRIIHTSDWHIGRTLFGKKRYDEFEAFLGWLSKLISDKKVDALLVAGDVFDTTTPGHKSQELYYRFLCQIASACRHVVVIGGNHDSPSFLNAPREILRAINVHVIGSAENNPDDEILFLKNSENVEELAVCAVPYLRDCDIRISEAGESFDDKNRKLLEGIRQHYSDVCKSAMQKLNTLKSKIPFVIMGHLFATGGKTIDGDGVRELYVGTLAHLSASIFPDSADYVALGHLHIPQMVNDSPKIRYSGSPLPMGFGEAGQQKKICQIDFVDGTTQVELINIPIFQKIESIKGSLEKILLRINALSASGEKTWLEIIYEGDEIIGNLRERLEEAISGKEIEILRIKNNRIIDRILNQNSDVETLDDLSREDIFDRCLAAHKIPDEQRPELKNSYHEILHAIDSTDNNT